MSVIAVASIGIGAAVGFGVVAASIATVATVLTVAAVVGVIGIGLTIAGKVTKNKLLGQIGMVMSMGALGATGGAMGAGALGLGGSAGGWAGAMGAVAPAGSTGAPAATAANVAAPTGLADDAVLAASKGAPSTVVGGGAGGAGTTSNAVVGAPGSVASAAPAPTVTNLGSSTGVTNVVAEGGKGVVTPSLLPAAPKGLAVTEPGTLANFFGTPGGATTLVAGVGGVAQMGGGMLQGLGASKAAQFNAEMQEKQLALERAKWERSNTAVPLYGQTYTKPSFAPTAPTVG